MAPDWSSLHESVDILSTHDQWRFVFTSGKIPAFMGQPLDEIEAVRLSFYLVLRMLNKVQPKSPIDPQTGLNNMGQVLFLSFIKVFKIFS